MTTPRIASHVAVLSLAGVLAGCRASGPYLALEVRANPSMTTVRRLDVAVAIPGKEASFVTDEQPAPLSWPAQLVVLLPRDTRGVTTVRVAALDVDGVPIAQGSAAGEVSGDGRLDVAVVLGEDNLSAVDGGVDDALTVTGPLDGPVVPTGVDGGIDIVVGVPGGGGSADGIGAAARFQRPSGMSLDPSSGDVFISDLDNHVIRRVAAAGGATSTVTGLAGVAGSADGSSTARLHDPTGLAFAAGALYIADRSNHAIRKFDPVTSALTTLYGLVGSSGALDGTGAAARFYSPRGLAFDGVDSLYVADTGNHTLRKISISSGVVSTLAGTAATSGSADGVGAAARFSSPAELAFRDGVLYVADTGNHLIRSVQVSTATVATIAGVPGTAGLVDGLGTSARFSSPIGLVLASADELLVGDSSNQVIRSIRLSSRLVSTVAGTPGYSGHLDASASAALFRQPERLLLDAQGRVLISDTGNYCVRRLDLSTQSVITSTGVPPSNGYVDGAVAIARLSRPMGIVGDGAGRLYLGDSNLNRIRSVDLVAGRVTTIAGSGQGSTIDGVGESASFANPQAIAYDPVGALYVADYDGHTIRRVALDTGAVTTIAGVAGVRGTVDGPANTAMFSSPSGLWLDGGMLYIADLSNQRVRKLDLAAAQVSTVAGSSGGAQDGNGTGARFNAPMGLVGDGAGHLFVADQNNHAVRRVDLATFDVTTIAGTLGAAGAQDGRGAAARFRYPAGLALDGTRLYVSDSGNHTLRHIDLADNNVTTAAGVAGQGGAMAGVLPARLNKPSGLARTERGLAISMPTEGVIALFH